MLLKLAAGSGRPPPEEALREWPAALRGGLAAWPKVKLPLAEREWPAAGSTLSTVALGKGEGSDWPADGAYVSFLSSANMSENGKVS